MAIVCACEFAALLQDNMESLDFADLLEAYEAWDADDVEAEDMGNAPMDADTAPPSGAGGVGPIASSSASPAAAEQPLAADGQLVPRVPALAVAIGEAPPPPHGAARPPGAPKAGARGWGRQAQRAEPYPFGVICDDAGQELGRTIVNKHASA